MALSSVVMTGGVAQAATLTSVSVALSDPRPSEVAGYTVTASSVTSAAIRCVQLVWATTPTGEINPAGFDGTAGTVTAASSTLVNSSATGWTLTRADGSGASAGADNKWQYTRASDVTPSTLTGATFVTAGITNGSTHDTGYYLRINTYSDQACTTGVDNATVQFIYTRGSQLSLTVDNSLSFTVNGRTTGDTCSDGATNPTVATDATTIPFGTVTSSTTGIACQRLNAATNATNGYTIYLRYDHAPRNGLNQEITDVTGTNNDPAAFATTDSQGGYGYTTSDTTLTGAAGTGAGQANRFNTGADYAAATTSNAEVGYESAGVTSTDYIVTHQVGITLTTQPGTYSNTIIYTCTPVY